MRRPDTEPTSVGDDLLIVDALILLLMDDGGAPVRGTGTLYCTLGGAVLTELALLGRIEVDHSMSLGGPRVTPSGEGPLPDPLLQSAYDTIAEKTRRVQPLLVAIGADPWRVVLDRLVDRGLLRHQGSRVLGVFRSTTSPADDSEHEARLRAWIRRVLEEGEPPDPRTATIIGLLSASGAPAVPATSPALDGGDGDARQGARAWSVGVRGGRGRSGPHGSGARRQRRRRRRRYQCLDGGP